MWLAEVLGIDQNVISIHHNKDIKLFSKDFVKKNLKTGQCIGKTKRYDLVLEVAISDTKSHFLLVIFSDFYLIIGNSEI